MLGKVLKYDILADYKKYLVVFAGLLISSIFLGVSNATNHDGLVNREYNAVINMLVVSMFIIFTVLLSAALVMVFAISTSRFYKNLMKDEGYLHHTLPVPTWQLILSKLLSAYIWYFVLAFVVAVCASVISRDPFLIFNFFASFKTELTANLGAEAEGVMAFFRYTMGYVLLAPFIVLSQVYFSLSIGNLSNKNKLGVSVLVFFGLYIVQQIVGTIFAAAFFVNNKFLFEEVAYDVGSAEVFAAFDPMLIGSYALISVFSITCYVLANYIFTKRLNLE